MVINSSKINLIIEGQGYQNTAIAWNDTANSTGGTANSFTIAIYAPNFIAYNISFQVYTYFILFYFHNMTNHIIFTFFFLIIN